MPLSPAYRAFVAEQKEATVWHDADFLEALAPAEYWHAIEVQRSAGLVAAMPVYLKPSLMGNSLTLPPLLRYNFPLLQQGITAAEYPQLLQECIDGARGLAVKLDLFWPPHLLSSARVLQRVNMLPRRTYFSDTSGTAADLLARTSKRKGRTLKKSMKYFSVSRGPINDEAVRILRMPFGQQEMDVPYQEARMVEAFNVLFAKQRAMCHYVHTPDGQLAGAGLSLYDAQRLYLWLVGSRTDFADPNAGSLANFDMLRWAAELGLPQADFLGSMLPGPAENRRQLGGAPVEYPHLFADTRFWTKALRRWRLR